MTARPRNALTTGRRIAAGVAAATVVIAAAITTGFAGGGSAGDSRRPLTPVSAARVDGREQAIARQLDGYYGAELAADTLRAAFSELSPPVRFSGGWWTLTVDVGARRLNISNIRGDNVELRVTAVGDGHLVLAPDTACEQRGAARTDRARLNWTRAGTYLRFHAVDVPCLVDKVLLTLSAWQQTRPPT
jgi:hypothetical protein